MSWRMYLSMLLMALAIILLGINGIRTRRDLGEIRLQLELILPTKIEPNK